MTTFLDSGPAEADYRMLLAHGAGAGMNSPFLVAITELLAERGVAVTRFEFAYMAARRDGGPKRPPPKAETLMAEYTQMIADVAARKPPGQALLIGGKSLGGRVASMIAGAGLQQGLVPSPVSGLVCLGYPFHPPNQGEKLRTEHLAGLTCPALIVQGERDPFGNRSEIEALQLSPHIAFAYIGDGDHDFGPRGASGFTRKGNLATAADAVAAFVSGLKPLR